MAGKLTSGSLFTLFTLAIMTDKGTAVIEYRKTHMNLTNIPTDIGLNTTQLFLDHNKLSSMIGAPTLTELEILNLEYNEFTEFPDLSSVSTSLLTVSLMNNNISSIDPIRLNDLTRLETLNLQHNHLSSFPDVSGPAVTIQTLKLSENSFTEIPEFRLLGAQKLNSLYLDNNNIDTINTEALEFLPHLQMLQLARNRISEIPAAKFWDVTPQLEILRLGQNNIEVIPSDFFQLMPNLRYFSSPYTNIVMIPAVCSKGGPSKEIILNQNSLKCHCQMKAAIVAQTMGKADFGASTCSEPVNLSGRLLASLTLADLDCQVTTGIFQETFFIADGGFDCGYPNITQQIAGVSQVSCATLCMANSHCYAYGFEPAAAGHMTNGLCGISEYDGLAAPGIQWGDFTYKFTEV